jgi:two-component system NtrC family sensor kinase
LTFLVVAGVGVLIVLLLTYLLTRAMILPLEDMVSATKRIAGGDLERGVAVRSGGEIGHLAVNFNKMLASLKSMKAEQEQWAHTLEKKVEERTTELMAMQSQMAQSEKLASMGRLAAGVAHEINNPLGGIMAFSMTALEDCDPEDPMREDLETIAKQTLRCREIVKGLLEFSRQSETEVARLEINPVVEDTLALLDKQAIFHDIKTVRRLQEDLPPVLIDPHQMQQVLVNILLNAADAMEESGTLTVETRADEDGEEVLIRISDTGKGIEEKDLALIFEPFYTTKKVGQGTGLGLAIVHGVVSRAGGRIDVSSRPGETTFSIYLPTAT